MRKSFVFLCVAVLTACFAYALTERNLCREDHQPPPNVEPAEKIGTIAGYGVFTVFVDEGGYGTDQATLDDIEVLSDDFRENEFDPRQAEANEIYDWLNATHEIDDGSGNVICPICGKVHSMSEYQSMRDTKVNRLNTLSTEIDDAWADLADTVRAMISDESYAAYLDAH
jgi:hypothetical protein